MPRLVKIVSCSSESAAAPAAHLLLGLPSRRWRAEAGTKQAVVLADLDGPATIRGLDVGNDASAFLEIQVGRSAGGDFQGLLPATALMTPLDSRKGTNTGAVRFIGSDKLAPAVARQKWDRIKIICTQPFNKNIAFGLSFIRLHDEAKTESGVGGQLTSLAKTSAAAKSPAPPGKVC